MNVQCPSISNCNIAIDDATGLDLKSYKNWTPAYVFRAPRQSRWLVCMRGKYKFRPIIRSDYARGKTGEWVEQPGRAASVDFVELGRALIPGLGKILQQRGNG